MGTGVAQRAETSARLSRKQGRTRNTAAKQSADRTLPCCSATNNAEVTGNGAAALLLSLDVPSPMAPVTAALPVEEFSIVQPVRKSIPFVHEHTSSEVLLNARSSAKQPFFQTASSRQLTLQSCRLHYLLTASQLRVSQHVRRTQPSGSFSAQLQEPTIRISHTASL